MTPTTRRTASVPIRSHTSAKTNGFATLMTGNDVRASPAVGQSWVHCGQCTGPVVPEEFVRLSDDVADAPRAGQRSGGDETIRLETVRRKLRPAHR